MSQEETWVALLLESHLLAELTVPLLPGIQLWEVCRAAVGWDSWPHHTKPANPF